MRRSNLKFAVTLRELLYNNTQGKIRDDIKEENGQLEKRHASVVDSIKLFLADMNKLPMHPIGQVVRKGNKDKPPKQNPHIQDSAPTKNVTNQV